MGSPLGEIAQIQVGFSFRSGLEPSSEGTVGVVQMKDVANTGVDFSSLTRTEGFDFKPNHWLEPGDIVFRSRGGNYKALLVSAVPGQVVIAAPLIRIRADRSMVVPGYLEWYLDLPMTHSQLAQFSRGTTQLLVGAGDLNLLEVEIPDLDTQSAILSVVQLQSQEEQLVRQIMDRRQALTTHLLQTTIVRPRSPL